MQLKQGQDILGKKLLGLQVGDELDLYAYGCGACKTVENTGLSDLSPPPLSHHYTGPPSTLLWSMDTTCMYASFPSQDQIT